MKIAVIGAGAMGGLFGGSLAEAGCEVVLIDIPGPHLSAMQARGLRLHTDAGDRAVAVQANAAGGFAGPHDLLIVFTKGPHTEAAIRSAAHLVGPDTRVLTLQNGLGNAEVIAGILPAARILVGMTNWPADLTGPGHVTSHGHGEVRLWTADGTDDPLVPAVVAALSQAGLNAIADPAVSIAIWEKVAFNAAMNSVSAVSRLAVGPMGDSAAGQSLVASIIEEAATVARAQGVAVQLDRIEATVAKAFAGHRNHQPSMLQDVLAGRQTEVEQINGAIARAGAAAGIPTPVTQALANLVRLIASVPPATGGPKDQPAEPALHT